MTFRKALMSLCLSGFMVGSMPSQLAAEPAPPPSVEAADPASPAYAAWRRYRETLDTYWQRFLATPAAADPQLRAQALYYLQAQEPVAFNFYVAPRTAFPVLYTHTYFLPLELSWGMPNPDFFYRNGFIDGARSYRVYGNLRSNPWSTFQVSNGFWAEDDMAIIHNLDFDDLAIEEDGSFEFFLGPSPPSDAKDQVWLKTDPTKHRTFIATRETLYDWDKDTPLELHIELLDGEDNAPIYPDEEELAERIAKATRYVAYNFEFALRSAAGAKFGEKPADVAWPPVRNKFVWTVGGQKEGGNPLGNWANTQYEVEPGEALIIEMDPIKGRYWGLQLGTIWGQTTDYAFHSSSINMQQAVTDADGKFRAVLSLSDPGVPNWLDPAGIPTGSVLLRAYKTESFALPTITRVGLSELRNQLPGGTPVITPEQRKIEVTKRRRSVMKRFGW